MSTEENGIQRNISIWSLIASRLNMPFQLGRWYISLALNADCECEQFCAGICDTQEMLGSEMISEFTVRIGKEPRHFHIIISSNNVENLISKNLSPVY